MCMFDIIWQQYILSIRGQTSSNSDYSTQPYITKTLILEFSDKKTNVMLNNNIFTSILPQT